MIEGKREAATDLAQKEHPERGLRRPCPGRRGIMDMPVLEENDHPYLRADRDRTGGEKREASGAQRGEPRPEQKRQSDEDDGRGKRGECA